MKSKRRRGTNLVEVLGVLVVLGILAGLGITSVASSVEKGRVLTAETALKGYQEAFTNVCIYHPGMISDRANVWESEDTYTSKQGLSKLVARMNERLDDELCLYWDSTSGSFMSAGLDPWGGKYILTEYPVLAGSTSYYDPTGDGESVMAISVWCTGNSDLILEEQTIDDESIGVCLLFTNGLIDTKTNGFDVSPFVGATLKMK